MKSPGYDYSGRKPKNSYDWKQTTDRGTRYSTGSPYDEAPVRRRNPVAEAARSLVGAIGSCFVPPEATARASRGQSGSDEFRTSVQGGNDRRRSANQGLYLSENGSDLRKEPGSVKFTMEEILKATKNFSPASKIGQGGFGTVYKGRLDDGSLVAIKRAKKVGTNGCILSDDFGLNM